MSESHGASLKEIFERVARSVHPPKEASVGTSSLLKLLNAIPMSITKNAMSDEEVAKLIELVWKNSVRTNSGFFMTQMFGKQQAGGILGDILTVLLNTSMYTYEVAPVLTLIENECIRQLSSRVWKTEGGDGIFTPGSSLANIMALVLARNRYSSQLSEAGLSGADKFCVFASDQLHYSFVKGASFTGLGTAALTLVESDSAGRVQVAALHLAIEREIKNGKIPLLVIGIAGTTTTGVFDDLAALGKVARAYHVWFHVDAAYGGSMLFSQKENHKLKGIEYADSVSWSLHKMMGIPLSCAVLLTRSGNVLRGAFAVNADYLFHGNEMDLGQKSLQCGRRADALKLWMAWKSEGEAGFEARVDKLIGIARRFAILVSENPRFELLCVPESPLVCFRFVPPGFHPKKIDDLNRLIREELFSEGHLLFNYSVHQDTTYLRCVFSDPDMEELSLAFILDRICSTGRRIAGHAQVAGG